MDAKKVWGVVIIVVGVILVGWGAYALIQISSASSQLNQLSGMMGGTAGASFTKAFGIDDAISSARNRGILILVLGIVASIGGTLLLKTSKKPDQAVLR